MFLDVTQPRTTTNAKKRLINNTGQNLTEISLSQQDLVKKFRPIVPRQSPVNPIRNNLFSGK